MSDKEKERYYRVEADVNLDCIDHNIKQIKKIIEPETKIMVIIKADGYGHGAIPIAKRLNHLVDGYGIAIVEEGIQLRKAGINKEILILGYTPTQQYTQLVKYDISPTIFSYSAAKELSKVALKENKTVAIHIKVDTGMNRLGFSCNTESVKEIKKISLLDGIRMEGIFTHFACADEENKSSTYKQLEDFLDLIYLLEKEGVFIPTKHISNSAGIIDIPEAHLDMVRCGIATYGLYPSKKVDQDKLDLRPALRLKTHISYIKEVEAGRGVSYGSTYKTNKKTKIATIPVGYGDGYPRNLSSRGRVLIHGCSAPIIGRICMDQFMVDITDIDNIEQEDEVTLLGRDGDEIITVEELASLSGTFNYEFICNLGKRIPRIYYSNNEIIDVIEY